MYFYINLNVNAPDEVHAFYIPNKFPNVHYSITLNKPNVFSSLSNKKLIQLPKEPIELAPNSVMRIVLITPLERSEQRLRVTFHNVQSNLYFKVTIKRAIYITILHRHFFNHSYAELID